MSASSTPIAPGSRSARYLLALAFGAGVVDAANYLGLGKVLTANMTGNTVLLGVALARGSGADAVRAACALGGFCLGAGAGVVLVRASGPWPWRSRRGLWLEAGALLALLLIWVIAGSASIRVLLIVISGVAMGAQSAAVRASDVRGVNTTYMTSTLVNAIARVIQRARGIRESDEGPGLPGAAWVTYALGAIAGAFAEKAWGGWVIAIPFVIVCAVGRFALGRR